MRIQNAFKKLAKSAISLFKQHKKILKNTGDEVAITKPFFSIDSSLKI
jgi:hypothetical protein